MHFFSIFQLVFPNIPPNTRWEQHGLTVADSYDVKKSAEAAAKDLAASFEIFGNWTDAAYQAILRH